MALNKFKLLMLSELLNTLATLRCPYGHGENVGYVNQSAGAKRRFLCEDCLFEDNGLRVQDIVKLDSYFNQLANFATNKLRPPSHIIKEVEVGSELATKLKQDLADSVIGMRESVERHYVDFIEQIKVSALKAKTRIQEKIDRDFKHAITEISVIETNLNSIKNGEQLQLTTEILDQAVGYVRRKPVADNPLYDLLSGLNPKSSIHSTKQRLSQYAARYVRRKVVMVQAVKDSLVDRQGKDVALCQTFISEGKLMISSLDGFVSDIIAQEKQTLKTLQDKEQQNYFGRKLYNDLLKNAKKQFGVGEIRNSEELGKRDKRSYDPESYDPKASFDRAFSAETLEKKLDEVDSKKLSTGRMSKLSELITSKLSKPTMAPLIDHLASTNHSRNHSGNHNFNDDVTQKNGSRYGRKRHHQPKSLNFKNLLESTKSQDNVLTNSKIGNGFQNSVEPQTQKQIQPINAWQNRNFNSALEKVSQSCGLGPNSMLFGNYSQILMKSSKTLAPTDSQADKENSISLPTQAAQEEVIKKFVANDPRRHFAEYFKIPLKQALAQEEYQDVGNGLSAQE